MSDCIANSGNSSGLPDISNYWSTPAAQTDDVNTSQSVLTKKEKQERAAAALAALNKSSYGSFHELLTAVNNCAEECGFAVRKRRASNKDPETQEWTRYDLECHHGQLYKDVIPKGRNKDTGEEEEEDAGDDNDEVHQKGEKFRGTKLTGCGWKAKAVLLKKTKQWVYEICEYEHNHEPDENPWDTTIHRKRRQADEKFRKRLFDLAMMPKSTAADIFEQLIKEFPGVNVKDRDIWNALLARRVLMKAYLEKRVSRCHNGSQK